MVQKITKTFTDSEKNAILQSPDFTLTSKAEYEGRRLKLYCKQVEKGGINNYSEIHWALKVEGGVVKYYAAGPTTITFADAKGSCNEKWSRTGVADVFPSSRNRVAYGCVRLDHNEDGTAPEMTISLSTAIYWGDWNLKTASNKWKARKINRFFTVTPNLTLAVNGLTETSVNYEWTTSEDCSVIIPDIRGKGDNINIEITGTNGDKTIAAKSGTIVVSNLLPGERYDINFNFIRRDSEVPTSVRQSIETYHYPYIKAITADVLYPPEMEGEYTIQSIQVYNPLNRKVKAYMGLIKDNTEEGIIKQDNTWVNYEEGIFYMWDFDQDDIYAFLKTVPYAEVYYYCKTQIGEEEYSSHKALQGRISILGNEVPDISGMSIQWYDGNTAVAAITGQGSPASTSKWMVQNLSTLTIDIGDFAVGTGMASIESYTVYYGKNTKVFLASEMTKTFTLDITGLSGTLDIKIAVKDSRGATAETNRDVIYIREYQPPTAVLTAKRINNYGFKVDLTYSFRTSSVSNKNGTKMWVTSSLDSSWIMYLVGAQNTWTTSPYAAGPFVWTLDDQDNDKAISYTTYIQDKFGDPIKIGTVKVERGQPIFFIDEEQLGVGVNCFPKGEGLYARRICLSDNVYIEYDSTLNSIVFKSEV